MYHKHSFKELNCTWLEKNTCIAVQFYEKMQTTKELLES